MTKNKNVKTAIAAVTLAAASFALPAVAHAQSYNNYNCSDTENAVIGGVVGGSLGSVIGKEIAGRGDRKEGAILGAIIGGVAGAAIGDGASNCEKTNTRLRTTNTIRSTGTRNATIQTVGYNTKRGYNTSYGNTSYSRGVRVDPLYQIDRQIEQLRYERDQLKRERKYSNRFRPRIERRLDQIAYQLDDLKSERKRVKKYGTSSRTVYRTTTRRAY